MPKRTVYDAQFLDGDGNVVKIIPREHSLEVKEQYDSWKMSGLPKSAIWIETEDEANPGRIHNYKFEDGCFCEMIIDSTREDIPERECVIIDCLPDDPGALAKQTPLPTKA